MDENNEGKMRDNVTKETKKIVIIPTISEIFDMELF